MVPPASPDAETNAALPASGMHGQSPALPAPATPKPPEAFETLPSQVLMAMQEQAQAYLHERLRVLEAQLLLDHQRQRDRLEEELHKMRQQLEVTVREQRQHHQTVSAAFREPLEEMRKELSDALYRLSQDVDRALRQSEAHNRRAIEKLQDEMLQALGERARAPGAWPLPGK